MTTQEQLVNDIKLLPDNALQSIGIIVKELISLNIIKKVAPKPVYGSGRGMMWIDDDFDAPLDELKEYME
jgi:hypothetical protein